MILVVNAGSSSIKVAVFDGGLVEQVSGIADGIGATGRLGIGTLSQAHDFPEHKSALRAVLSGLDAEGYPLSAFRAAAHRVVHGGSLSAPARITPDTLAAIRAAIPLAPLHNPHNLAAIETLARLAPGLPQTASFDTAFHATNPEVATRYALPAHITARGIRRYGFHGISFAALTEALPRLSGAPLPARLLALHLGNGASLCAIRDGRSVATTMGYSPLGGLTMGTRTGEIDGNAVLRLAEEDGIDATRRLLNHESGLRGLSGGLSDMRALIEADTAESRFAIDHFCYWTVRQAGSLIAAMGGVDALAFTGGIGENAAPVRARIVEGLGWLGARLDAAANAAGAARLHAAASSLPIWIVPAAEEARIAADALALLDA
ncbi:MAG: acetate kinase [Alphaproteobacteria bacterium HGW-Alphaproteobacteria-1]|jgi:acetate kinase|nr:MAG: acetate kinase [Alphaproteobacteria bacterium HGW-Alphaproteobacteria-1]